MKKTEIQKFIKSTFNDLSESTFVQNREFIEKNYNQLTLEQQIDLFKYVVRYPNESFASNTAKDQPKIKEKNISEKDYEYFEKMIIQKYIINGTSQDDYLIFFIKNKQRMFDLLFEKYIQVEDNNQSIVIVNKLITIFLDSNQEIEISNNQIIGLTRVMDRQLSFVLASFFSQKRSILEGSDYEQIFLPRLDAYLNEIRKKPKIEKKSILQFPETINCKPLNLPSTCQHAIKDIQSGILESDCLIFYIFTTQKQILNQNFPQLLAISLQASTPIFLVVLSERLAEYTRILNYFFSCSNQKEKERILECWLLLKDIKWTFFEELKNNFRTKSEQKLNLSKQNKSMIQKCFNIVLK